MPSAILPASTAQSALSSPSDRSDQAKCTRKGSERRNCEQFVPKRDLEKKPMALFFDRPGKKKKKSCCRRRVCVFFSRRHRFFFSHSCLSTRRRNDDDTQKKKKKKKKQNKKNALLAHPLSLSQPSPLPLERRRLTSLSPLAARTSAFLARQTRKQTDEKTA